MASVFGHPVRTDLPFERLAPVAGTRAALAIERDDELRGGLDAHGRLIAWSDDDDNEFGVVRLDDGRLVVHCQLHGHWLLDAEAPSIVAAPGGGSEAGWEHRTLAAALPILCAERGDLVLHAAAVAIGDRAVLFCGSRGAGKSSLCLALALAGQKMISEDGVAISVEDGGPVAWPGPAGVRLKVDPPDWAGAAHAGPVTIVDTPPGPGGPLPIGGLVALGARGPELAIEPLDAAEALAAISPSAIHAGGIAAFRPQFGRLARVLAERPAWRVSMPDDLDGLPDAARGLVACLDAGGRLGSPA